MRAGTQTLIQALQALPWVDDQDNEDDNDTTPVDTESDDDDKPGMFCVTDITMCTYSLL